VALATPTSAVRFAWQNLHGNWSRGATQTQFQLQVLQNTSVNTGNSTNKGTVVFDSGKVQSAAQQFVLPPKVSLAPGTDYAWRVQTIVGGKLSTFSTPLQFTTAPSSWGGAQWIGGHNQLRSNFSLPRGAPTVDGGWVGKPTRARAYVSGLGAFYLYVNGERIGDHVLDPPQTVYPKRVDYIVFDVLSSLVQGENVVGALLGNYKCGCVCSILIYRRTI
jgi:alpha-L-rhamnosidase